jgi:hypothetical protein
MMSSHTHPSGGGGGTSAEAAKRRRIQAWKRRRAYRAGSLRIFTLSGLQASATSRCVFFHHLPTI